MSTNDMALRLTEFGNIILPSPNFLPPFCLNSSNRWEFCINNRKSLEVLQLGFDIKCEEGVNVVLSHTHPRGDKPTRNLCRDPTALYNSATNLQKEQLALDGLLLPEVSTLPPAVGFIRCALAPKPVCDCGPYSSFLATLTSYGVLTVLRKGFTETNWVELADLTSVWQRHTALQSNEHEVTPPQNVYQSFVELSQNVQLVSFDWQRAGRNPLVSSMACSTATGKCIFFDVAKADGKSRVSFVADLQQDHRINQVSWLTTGRESFLCTANVLGHVRLYRVTIDETTHTILSVHLEVDIIKWEMICHIEFLTLEFDPETNRMVVIVSIGARLVVGFIPLNDVKSFRIVIHSLDQHSITGISKVSPLIYAVCTSGGLVQRITLNPVDCTLGDVQSVQTSINSDKYLTIGMEVSQREGLWLFVLQSRLPVDHLTVRFPITISIHGPDPSHMLAILTANSSRSLTGYMDCVESIRMGQMCQDSLVNFDGLFGGLNVDMDDEGFLYQLRLQNMLLATRFSYIRRNEGSDEIKALATEQDFIRRTIHAVLFYRRMYAAAAESPKTWMPLQATSIANIMGFLVKYSAENWPPKYEEIASSLATHISVGRELWFIEENAYESLATEECCHHCDDVLSAGNLECTQGHSNPRCCVTYLQLPVLCSRSCLHCGNIAMDLDVLSEIVSEEYDAQMCPICDVKLVSSSYV